MTLGGDKNHTSIIAVLLLCSEKPILKLSTSFKFGFSLHKSNTVRKISKVHEMNISRERALNF